MFKKAGNDYKLLPYKVGPGKFCETLKTETMLYPKIVEVSDFPKPGVCPWPAKTYQMINGYEPDLSTIPKILETGDYMVEIRIEKKGELFNGYRVYASIINMANPGK